MSEEIYGYSQEELAKDPDAALDHMQQLEELHNDFVATFSTPSGERIYRYLYLESRQGRSCFVQGDSHYSAFLEGRRNLFVKIMEYVHIDDDEIIRRARDRTQPIRN